MVDNLYGPQIVSAKGGLRFSLPQAYCQKLPWIRGEQKIRVWLLQLAPGRYRILPDVELEKNEALREIRSRILDGPGEPDADPASFEAGNIAALVGRLIVTTLSAPPPSWRLMIPKQLSPDDDTTKFVLLFSIGYLEMWHIDTYNAALAAPLNGLI